MTTFPRRTIFALALAAGCGGKATPASEQPPPEGMAFKDMDHDQRAAFMKQTVLPTMKPIFQAFDADEFADFTCKTCHGEGAEDHTFKMPNPGLPKLPGTEEAFKAYAENPDHAPWVQFMVEKVKPTMAGLLQMAEFDPATNNGEFGCQACHTFESAAQ